MADLITLLTLHNQWLDEEISLAAPFADGLTLDHLRVEKIAEEVGEAIQALIGRDGLNPRKGKTHTEQQVLDELADVVITAYLAIQHFTADAPKTVQIVADRWTFLVRRIGLFV